MLFGIWSGVVVRVARATELAETFDDQLAGLVKTLPGFGGCFIDEEGWLNVYLLNPHETTPEVARAALEPVYARRLPSRIRLIKGAYDFLELKQWADRLFMEVMSLPDLVSSDIDERRNRLVIGISSEASPKRREEAMADIERLIAERMIPRAAVVTEERPPVRFE